MNKTSQVHYGVFDHEIPDPGSFWTGETTLEPEGFEYESPLFIKNNTLLKKFAQRWLVMKAPLLYFSEKKKVKSYKILNLRTMFCKLFETVLDEKKKNRWKITLNHHSHVVDFFFENEETMKKWVSYLRPYCILSDLTSNYRIGTQISTGVISKTFWAKSKDSSKEFSAKVYYLSDPTNRDQVNQAKIERQMILNEIKALTKIDQTNVIKLKEIHEFRDRIVLMMEFVSGSSLLKYISLHNSIPEQESAYIAKTLLTSLKAIHEQNIAIRNLKPENVYLNYSKNGTELKITEFSFSCSFNSEEETSWYLNKNLCSKCGTPGYLAPEVLGNKLYDQSVDVFSMGVILFTCLSGQPLFNGTNVEEIIKKNYECEINKESKHWKALSFHARDLVIKMTKRNPKHRISIDDALKHNFFVSPVLLDPKFQ